MLKDIKIKKLAFVLFNIWKHSALIKTVLHTHILILNKEEVVGWNTNPANKLILAGTVLANNLLLSGTPQGPFQDPSRTLMEPLWKV